MKLKFILLPLLLIAGIFTALHFFSNGPKTHFVLFADASESDGGEGSPDARTKWELMRLADPVTGKIPDNIRARELAFAASLPKFESFSNARASSATPVFSSRGPWNLGGRTRAVAVDVTNDSIILSGTVSGGLWRSTDRGNTWKLVSGVQQMPAISCIIQDIRPRHTNTWYYGTGEGTSASASAAGAYYSGNGIYKSTDDGLTWDSLPSTYSTTPHFAVAYDLNWDLAMDYSDTAHEVIYEASVFYGINMSKDGGNTWTTDLSTDAYYTDVKVTSTGIVYASASTFSDVGDTATIRGIWRKQDSTWTQISPPDWDTTVFNRYVIGINPSNENEVYFLAGNTPYHGIKVKTFVDSVEWNSLWKYTYMSGNGAGSGGMWQDLSLNLPHDTSTFGGFYSQYDYDLIVKVHPDSSNIVYIGGTNLYRSTDGFASANNTRVIGGYNIYSSLPFYKLYPGHHPDQHNIVFLPSNHNVMIETNDGGIYQTMNDLADSVIWRSINNGYITGQFYTVAIDHSTVPNDIVIGGTQDYGTWFTNNTTLTRPWTMPGTGDGSVCYIDAMDSIYYISRTEGAIAKAKLDTAGNVTTFTRIDPIDGITKEGYLFVNPFIIDPNNSNAMFLAAGNHVWRNDSLNKIPFNNQWDSISQGWFKFPDSVAGFVVTALAMSKNPSGRLYYSEVDTPLAGRKLFRVDNPYSSTPTPVEITGTKVPNVFPNSGYISCIAVDPTDADKVMVVFSNYSIYNLYYTTNGGASWSKVAGNLSSSEGPSLRWASIIPVSSGTIYLVGTSIGLFGTNSLADTTHTVWTQLAPNEIGNRVVDMIDYRTSDGLVAVATHGGGIYTANITDILPAAVINQNISSLSLNIYPNPAALQAIVSFSLDKAENISMKVFDSKGTLEQTLMEGKLEEGLHQYVLNRKNMSPGVYYVNIRTGDAINETQKVVFIDLY